MGLTARLAQAAGFDVIEIGSLELVAWQDTDAFLRVVNDKKMAIVGIEGFRIDGSRAIPDMAAIADFSGIPIDEELVVTTLEEARRFLSSVSRPGMYFSILRSMTVCMRLEVGPGGPETATRLAIGPDDAGCGMCAWKPEDSSETPEWRLQPGVRS